MPHPYRLTKHAQNDLREIARYTLKTWGKEALHSYRNGISNTFMQISNGNILEKCFSDVFPELLVTRYKHHYIFYLKQDPSLTVIIGVIHERRDIVSRLTQRLG